MLSSMRCVADSAWHRGLAHRDPQVGLGEVGERPDLLRIARRGDDHQRVGCEVDRFTAGQIGLDHGVHLGGVRRGEDVGAGALSQFVRQLGGRREVEFDCGAGIVGLKLAAKQGEGRLERVVRRTP